MPRRIILLAGWAHPGRALQPLAELLREHAAITLFGHEDLHPDYAAALISDLRQHGPAILAGWSMGGMIALQAASQAPDLVEGLGLISSTPRFSMAPGEAGGMPDAQILDLMRQLKVDIKTTLGGFTKYSALPNRPRWRDMMQSMDVLLAGLNYLRDTDLREKVPLIRTRTAILHGLQDTVIPASAGRWLADRIEKSVFTTVDHMGHDLPLREPELVARIIVQQLL